MTLFLFTSCDKKNEDNEHSLIMLANMQENIQIDSIFTDFKYISLETTNESIIGGINKIQLDSDSIFLLDRDGMKKIFIFGKSGKFYNSIGKIGKGPGEYIRIKDFVVDKESKTIVALCNETTVIRFDFDGNVIEAIKLIKDNRVEFINIVFCGGNYFFTTDYQASGGKRSYLLYQFDSNFKLENKFLEYQDNAVMRIGFRESMFEYDGNLLYFDIYKPAIHSCNQKDILTIPFDFDESYLPFSLLKNPNLFLDKNSEYCFFSNAIVTENIIFTTFLNRRRKSLAIIDLQTYKVVSYRNVSGLFDFINYYEDSIFYSSMSAHFIMRDIFKVNAVNSTNYPITMNSNPVILTYKLRKDAKIN